MELPDGQGHVERGLLSRGGPGPPRARGKFDELRFYAEHFDTVEVNSELLPDPDAAATRQRWAERTPAGFEFSLKLFRSSRIPKCSTRRPARTRGTSQKDVDEFRAALDPLASADKLGALLAQFPASFKNEPDTRGYLEWLLEAVSRVSDGRRTAAPKLERRPGGDPEAAGSVRRRAGRRSTNRSSGLSIRQNLLPNVKTFYYLRLHGRNAAKWWKHEKSEDRYNYLYSSRGAEAVRGGGRSGVGAT